jgi:hypothetical protein
MTLEVIGSGFGRTGTLTLKEALEVLGFGPCHHMEEVFANPPQVAFWQGVARGEAVQPEVLFAGYRSQVDWPGAHVWRESAAAFPAAKVIHSTRPEVDWWRSFSGTIGELLSRHRSLPLPPHAADMAEAVENFIGGQTFGGNWQDRETCLAAFRAREREVRAAIPADRLLVYDVAEGWGPLCAFLGVPVPDTPFPHRNRKDDFWRDFGGTPS